MGRGKAVATIVVTFPLPPDQISKESVDTVKRSSFLRSEYANYIDYPPRILMRVQQTAAASQTPNSCPKLKLKGTLQEKSFNLPLPASDSTPSPHPHQTPSKNSSPLSHPHHTPDESNTGPGSGFPSPFLSSPPMSDRRSLVSLKKERSLYSAPDLKELAEKVTPHLHPKWYDVGLQLGLSTATLNGIELCHPTEIKRRLNDVFSEWICRSEENPTWTKLLEILRSECIGENRLANELEKSFTEHDRY